VKEAHFVSILAHPRLESCSDAVSSQDKQLVIAFSIKGQNATGFCKDLTDEFSSWQVSNPEQLHQKILDLLSFTRQKRLELEFALSLLTPEKIIFATYSGEVILKRNGQVRKILESNKEIKIIVGNFKDNDQIVLINKSAIKIEEPLLQMLEVNVSLERLVSEMSLIQQEHKDLSESLAFLTYKVKADEKNLEETKKVKINFKKAIFISKLIFKRIQEIVKKIIPLSKKIVVKLKNQDRKKMLIMAAIFFSLALILFGYVAIAKAKNTKTVSYIEKQVTEINKNTSNINQLVLEQPLLARESAQKSLTLLENLKKEKNNKNSLKLIEDEINKLKTLIKEISCSNSLDKLSVAYNLDQFIGSKMEIKDGQFFILENSGQEILRIKTGQSKEKIALSNNDKIRDFTISENKLFVLSGGIKMLDLAKNETAFAQIKEEGESDKTGEFLSSFGQYLYLLNKEKRNIYRYYYKDDKLSEPIGWLVDKQGINFENVNDLAIDGDLWVAMKNGNLLKFAKGSKADFTIKGLGQLPSNQIIISSSEENNSIAILEKQNKRLLILTKDGQLINEIKSNELAGVSSIAFNKEANKIYALSGSVIYEVDLGLQPNKINFP
jgi:hypothetical protein